MAVPAMSVAEMRAAVLARDAAEAGGCVAPFLDPDAGPCYDKWGYPLWVRMDLEADYVRTGHRGAHHELAGDHVALCAGHHRGTGPQGGRVWATANRALLRDYLSRVGRETDAED
jgi:hypothetical protein